MIRFSYIETLRYTTLFEAQVLKILSLLEKRPPISILELSEPSLSAAFVSFEQLEISDSRRGALGILPSRSDLSPFIWYTAFKTYASYDISALYCY
ncbi:hypothetical protein AYI70_g6655 [Smittium culicis]|uniref:Uncharacterized protein n=1 Tax=Smittium culicis TaxID=133412 RepID=A0A1R1XNY4_9FUNG|nr:hypothetical protein AYI70_g6655 [Smittium culicis]